MSYPFPPPIFFSYARLFFALFPLDAALQGVLFLQKGSCLPRVLSGFTITHSSPFFFPFPSLSRGWADMTSLKIINPRHSKPPPQHCSAFPLPPGLLTSFSFFPLSRPRPLLHRSGANHDSEPPFSPLSRRPIEESTLFCMKSGRLPPKTHLDHARRWNPFPPFFLRRVLNPGVAIPPMRA